MKKLLLIAAGLGMMAGTASAQGFVNWDAINYGYFTAETNTSTTFGGGPGAGGAVGPTAGAPGDFYFELLYNQSATSAPTTITALDTWSDTGLEAENSAVAGRVEPLNPSAAATVPFSTASSVIMVGWSANLGSTWSAASAALNSPTALASVVGESFFGESSLGTITPTSSGPVGATIFGPAPEDINSVNTPLYATVLIPEPGTIALGVTGGLSLLVLRRKKA